MEKELNINLKNETNDEIRIKISSNYAEILTDEDRAYLKGNFEKLNGIDSLLKEIEEDFVDELSAFETALEKICKIYEVEELLVECDNYGTRICDANLCNSPDYLFDKMNYAKKAEVNLMHLDEIKESVTKVNNTLFIHSSIGYALIEKNKETIVKISSRTDFNVLKEFEWFFKEVRRQEEKMNS